MGSKGVTLLFHTRGCVATILSLQHGQPEVFQGRNTKTGLSFSLCIYHSIKLFVFRLLGCIWHKALDSNFLIISKFLSI